MQVTGGNSILFHLFWQQMAASDFALFFFRISRQPNYLHSVAQGRLDGIQHISRRHENDVRQIKCDSKIIVTEAVVLLRIKHLE